MSLKEAKKKISESIKLSKKGNKIGSFSRNDFNKLVNAYLNDINYSMDTVVVHDGKTEGRSAAVPKEFREKFIKPILVDFGVPKQEAENIVNNYAFKHAQTDCLYDLIMDIIYQYMETGKKLNFPNREDFTGSIRLKEVDGGVTVNRDGKKTKRGKHKTLVKKSSCPSWLRNALS